MSDVDTETLEGLAGKLDGLDLTEPERALLDQLVDRATAYEPGVSGFASFKYLGDASGADLTRTAFRIGSGIGLFPTTFGFNDPGDFRPPPP